jgi:O-antigen/teichoic acid export membrane protein
VIAARRLWLPFIGIAAPSRERMKRLVRAGLPLMVSNVVVAATLAGDRIFVAAALPGEFGQYTFAAMVVLGWVAILGMLEQVVAPRLLHHYGEGTELRDLRREAVRIVLMIGALGIAGLVALLLLTGPLESGALSEYAQGLEVMPILYLGGMLTLFTFPGFVLHAVRPAYSAAASGLAAAVTVVGGFILVAGHPSLNDFAWLFVAAQGSALALITLAVELEVRRNPVSPNLFGDD